MPQNASQKVLQLARRHGSVSRETVTAAGIHTQALSRLVRGGELERVAPGQYRVPNAPVTEHHGLAVVATAAPKAVVCLLSALNFHQIGSQLPHTVWIAVDRRARRPRLARSPLHNGGDPPVCARLSGRTGHNALSRGTSRVTAASKGLPASVHARLVQHARAIG
jgi:hypothetical protein